MILNSPPFFVNEFLEVDFHVRAYRLQVVPSLAGCVCESVCPAIWAKDKNCMFWQKAIISSMSFPSISFILCICLKNDVL